MYAMSGVLKNGWRLIFSHTKRKGQGQTNNINRLVVPTEHHLIISYCSCNSRLFHVLNIDLFAIKFTGNKIGRLCMWRRVYYTICVHENIILGRGKKKNSLPSFEKYEYEKKKNKSLKKIQKMQKRVFADLQKLKNSKNLIIRFKWICKLIF